MCLYCDPTRVTDDELAEEFVGVSFEKLDGGKGRASVLCSLGKKRAMNIIYGVMSRDYEALLHLLEQETKLSKRFAATEEGKKYDFDSALQESGILVYYTEPQPHLHVNCVSTEKNGHHSRITSSTAEVTNRAGETVSVSYAGRHAPNERCPGYCLILYDFFDDFNL